MAVKPRIFNYPEAFCYSASEYDMFYCKLMYSITLYAPCLCWEYTTNDHFSIMFQISIACYGSLGSKSPTVAAGF